MFIYLSVCHLPRNRYILRQVFTYCRLASNTVTEDDLELPISPCLYLLPCRHSGFFVVWSWNPGLYVWYVSALPIKLHPSPSGREVLDSKTLLDTITYLTHFWKKIPARSRALDGHLAAQPLAVLSPVASCSWVQSLNLAPS